MHKVRAKNAGNLPNKQTHELSKNPSKLRC